MIGESVNWGWREKKMGEGGGREREEEEEGGECQ